MTTRAPRPFAVLTAAIAAVAMTAGTIAAGLGFGAAEAKPPPKPGPVTGLQMTLTKPGANFKVDASWNAATNATSYVVVLANATTGVQLAGSTVNVTSWSASVNLSTVTQVRLTVTPRNRRSGPAASITQDVPDLDAPDGTYDVSWVVRTGTITQTSLTDNRPVSEVTRTVNWGDGTGDLAWPTGDTINHDYAADGLYRPTVTLEDGSGNVRVVNLAAIVPGDVTPPVGTFTSSPDTAWKDVTPVVVTQTSLDDDFSDGADVERLVDWGDGGPPEAWIGSLTISHVYATAGSFTPKVTLRDEAGNTSSADAQPVTIVADTVLPIVKIKLPRRAVRDEVSAWKRVTGTASDVNGTGVNTVAVRAIEKRATGWFFYKASTKSWAKAATRGKAWLRSRPAVVKPTAAGAWTVRLAGLKKGTLYVRATATDRGGNVSKSVTKRAVLTAL